MVVKLVALVLPLGLDTLAVSLTLGVSGVSAQQRLRTSLLFIAFEATMPLVGLAIGRGVDTAVGSAADFLAIGVLFALAIAALATDGDDVLPAMRLDGGIGAAIALGLSISLDEVAIGFAFGLLRVPIIPVIALIALQTLIVAQIGMRVGTKIGEGLRERAEPLAGVALLLLGVGLVVAKLVG